jgi:hypothetical protein
MRQGREGGCVRGSKGARGHGAWRGPALSACVHAVRAAVTGNTGLTSGAGVLAAATREMAGK